MSVKAIMKKTRNKIHIYLLIIGILISLICISTAVVKSKQRNACIEDLLNQEIFNFYAAADECRGYEDTELNSRQFNEIFCCLGACSAYSDIIRYFTTDYDFMYRIIYEYIWEFRLLSRDQGIYQYHPKEYYDDLKADILIIADWLENMKDSHSYNKITSYEFNLNVRVLLSESFDELMIN